jgi:hypothetical protein
MSLGLSLQLSLNQRQKIGDFSPSNISNLAAWYDASDASTINTAGNLVNQWDDKSGNNNHVIASGGDRPSSGTRTLNSLNVIDANGSNMLSTTGVVMSPNFSIFIVAVVDTVNNAQDSLLAMDDVNDFQIDAGNASQFRFRFNQSGLGTNGGPGASAVAGPDIYAVLADGAGGNLDLEYGQASHDSDTGFTATLTTPQTIRLFTNRAGSQDLDGAIGEILIYSKLVSSSEKANIYNYLSTKWGV